MAGPRSVRRGGRAVFVYRIRNDTLTPLRGVVATNTLPRGLGIDATSRRANLKVSKSLRFTGRGRKITFRVGTIGAGRTIALRVNAKVAPKASRGTRKNALNVLGAGIRALAVTMVTIT
jgi:hypothetical protein